MVTTKRVSVEQEFNEYFNPQVTGNATGPAPSGERYGSSEDNLSALNRQRMRAYTRQMTRWRKKQRRPNTRLPSHESRNARCFKDFIDDPEPQVGFDFKHSIDPASLNVLNDFLGVVKPCLAKLSKEDISQERVAGFVSSVIDQSSLNSKSVAKNIFEGLTDIGGHNLRNLWERILNFANKTETKGSIGVLFLFLFLRRMYAKQESTAETLLILLLGLYLAYQFGGDLVSLLQTHILSLMSSSFEPQSALDPMDLQLIMTTVLFGGVAAKHLFSSQRSSLLSTMRDFARWDGSIAAFCTFLISFTSKAYSLLARYFDLPNRTFFKSQIPLLQEWVDSASQLITSITRGELRPDAGVADRLLVKFAEGQKIIAETTDRRQQQHVIAVTRPISIQISALLEVMQKSGVYIRAFRIQPCTVLYKSAPCNGKSLNSKAAVVEALGSTIPEHKLSSFLRNPETCVYYRQEEHKYWDGYYFHEAIMWDDAGQRVESANTETSGCMDFLRSKNEARNTFHAADNALKGLLIDCSRWWFITTNEQVFDWKTIKTPEAFNRRIDCEFTVVPPLAYCARVRRPLNGIWDRKLDLNKVPDGKFHPEMAEYWLKGRNTPMTYEEHMNHILSKYYAIEKESTRVQDAVRYAKLAAMARRGIEYTEPEVCDDETVASYVRRMTKECNKRRRSFQRGLDVDLIITDVAKLYASPEEKKYHGLTKRNPNFKMPLEKYLHIEMQKQQKQKQKIEKAKKHKKYMENLRKLKLMRLARNIDSALPPSPHEHIEGQSIIESEFDPSDYQDIEPQANDESSSQFDHYSDFYAGAGSRLGIRSREFSQRDLDSPEFPIHISENKKRAYVQRIIHAVNNLPGNHPCKNLPDRTSHSFKHLKWFLADIESDLDPERVFQYFFPDLPNLPNLPSMYWEKMALLLRTDVDIVDVMVENVIPEPVLEVIWKSDRYLRRSLDNMFDYVREALDRWKQYISPYISMETLHWILDAGKSILHVVLWLTLAWGICKVICNTLSSIFGVAKSLAPSVKKKAKPWYTEEIENPEPQVQNDQNATEILIKVMKKNVYSIEFEGVHRGWACFIGPHLLHVTSHVYRWLQQERDNWYWDKDGELTFIPANPKAMPIRIFMKELLERVVIDKTSRDYIFFDLTGVCGTHPDIRHHFLDPSSYKITSSSEVLVPRPFDDKPIQRVRAYNSFLPTYEAFGKVVSGRTTVSYECPTVKGDCGLPIIIIDKHSVPKIIGFHIGGSKSAGRGFCVMLNTTELKPVPDIECQGLDMPPHVFEDRMIHLPTRTFFVRSPLYGEWGPAFKAPSRLIPTMVDGKVVFPMDRALKGMVRNEFKEPLRDHEVVCHYMLSRMLKSPATLEYARKHSPLSFEEAVAGVQGEEYLGGIPRGTSGGHDTAYRLVKNKTPEFGKDGPYTFTSNEASTCRKAVFELLEKCASPSTVDLQIVFDAYPKDELLKLEKVAKARTRVFYAGPMHFCIAFVMYWKPIIAGFMKTRIGNMTAPGINPFSEEWHHLAGYMSQILESKDLENVLSLDFEEFDFNSKIHNLDPIFLELATSVYGINQRDFYIAMNLVRNLYRCIMFYRNKGWLVEGKNMSGQPGTTFINTLMALFNLFFAILIYSARDIKTFRAIADEVVPSSYGDDLMVAVSSTVKKILNLDKLQECFKSFGAKVTNFDKKSEIRYCKLSEIEFLKRSFRYSEELDRIVAPLDLKTILEIPYWTKDKRDWLEIAQTNVERALLELALHPKSTWDEYAPQILDACRRIYNWMPPMPDRYTNLLFGSTYEPDWLR